MGGTKQEMNHLVPSPASIALLMKASEAGGLDFHL